MATQQISTSSAPAQAISTVTAQVCCTRPLAIVIALFLMWGFITCRNDILESRVAVEQASTFGWERYVGDSGYVIGMNTFGALAPLKELQKKFGFESDEIVAAAKRQLGGK